MYISPRILSTAAAIAVTCVVSAAAYYYKSRHTEINEVMIFCKLQYNAYNCFDKLISFVEAAKKSVHVCMPGIHNAAIQGRLVELIKKKNIKARLIIDRAGYNESTHFLIQELKEAGAEIKCLEKEPTHKMEHKFCLVDDEVLMTGTLNWGNDRSSDHWNYVYITSKTQLVDPVKNGFYQMWNEFTSDLSAINYCEEHSDSDEQHSDVGETVNLMEGNCRYMEDYKKDTLKEKSLTPELYLA